MEADIKSLRLETEKLVLMYENLECWDNTTRIKEAVLKANVNVMNAIQRLFENLKSFKIIKERTEGVISWRQWPLNSSRNKRWEFLLGEGRYNKMLRINYRYYKTKDDVDIYLMQNSFWNKQSRSRISPTMYTVMISHGQVTVSTLPSLSLGKPSLTGTTSAAYFLGFVQRDLQLPEILVLDGPHGSGNYSQYYLYSYNGKQKCWEYKSIVKSQGTSEYSYDEESQQLQYKRLRFTEPLGRKFTDDIIFVICDNQMPLKLKISAIEQAVYSRAEVPLEVIFENSGIGQMKIGSEYIDDYAGMFFVDLRRMNGDPVLNVPRNIVTAIHREPFELKENESHAFYLDIAKLYNVNKLEKGVYEVCLEYVNSNTNLTNYFSGLVKSNTINLQIQNGK
ncbi:MAG: hypothetical protein JW837_15325 [Sedimentisphaerales bacterium]|nr:hypothetical protein [Sedimentisphaerales bacterium]